MRALVQVRAALPAAGLAFLSSLPLTVALIRRPSWILIVVLLSALVVAWAVAQRLRAHGESRYFIHYILYLYFLLAPGMIVGSALQHFLFYYAASVALVVLPIVFPHGLLRAFFRLGVLFALAISTVFLGYAAKIGELPTRNDLIAVFQTDAAEAIGYVLTFIDPAALAITATSVLIFALGMGWSSRLRAFPYSHQLLALGCAFGIAWEMRDGSNEHFVLKTMVKYYRSMADYRRTAALRQVDLQQIDSRQTRDVPETHVIVIGESSTRNHFGLYGYVRDTTPHLSGIADELVVFRDAISSGTLTVHSLEQALTLADVDNGFDYADTQTYSVIELLRAAGTRTSWLSNQNRYGFMDNLVTVLAEGADRVTFLSDRSSTEEWQERTAKPDEHLLPLFERALEDRTDAKVIFVHLMGAHFPYDRRYPSEFSRFEGPLSAAAFGDRDRSETSRTVNAYDNAILYIDHVVYRMLEIIKRSADPATLMYFSDHGEAPQVGRPRYGSHQHFHRDQVEIPLFIWFSQSFAERHPELLRSAKANRKKRFMLDDLEDTILDLVGIETPHLEPERSLLRATYAEPSRVTLSGEIDYDQYDDPLLNTRRNMRRIGATRPALHERMWSHRVNSLGKLSEVVDIFAGVELDLMFDQATGRLEVRHPPKPYNGLTLKRVLDDLRARHSRIKLWLDIKNLNGDNSAGILARLSELDRRYGLKDRVSVETIFTGKGFEHFAANGFYTSYNLSTEKVPAALAEGDTERLTQLAAEACAVAQRLRVAAVSFDMRLYPFVREYLAPCAAKHDLDYMTRDLALSSSTSQFTDVATRRALDERIKVILVPVTSRYDT